MLQQSKAYIGTKEKTAFVKVKEPESQTFLRRHWQQLKLARQIDYFNSLFLFLKHYFIYLLLVTPVINFKSHTLNHLQVYVSI